MIIVFFNEINTGKRRQGGQCESGFFLAVEAPGQRLEVKCQAGSSLSKNYRAQQPAPGRAGPEGQGQSRTGY